MTDKVNIEIKVPVAGISGLFACVRESNRKSAPATLVRNAINSPGREVIRS